MNGIEIETSDGWEQASAHVVALGGGRFRASVRLPAHSKVGEPRLRFEGRPIRGVVRAEPRVESSPRRDTVVIEFRTA